MIEAGGNARNHSRIPQNLYADAPISNVEVGQGVKPSGLDAGVRAVNQREGDVVLGRKRGRVGREGDEIRTQPLPIAVRDVAWLCVVVLLYAVHRAFKREWVS